MNCITCDINHRAFVYKFKQFSQCSCRDSDSDSINQLKRVYKLYLQNIRLFSVNKFTFAKCMQNWSMIDVSSCIGKLTGCKENIFCCSRLISLFEY